MDTPVLLAPPPPVRFGDRAFFRSEATAGNLTCYGSLSPDMWIDTALRDLAQDLELDKAQQLEAREQLVPVASAIF